MSRFCRPSCGLLPGAFLLVAALAGCGGNDTQAKPKGGPAPAVPVLVAAGLVCAFLVAQAPRLHGCRGSDFGGT